jgi:hypothetical protein
VDVDALDETPEPPAWRFAGYFIAHRRELKIIAQVGFVVSLIRLGAACFKLDWPGQWAVGVLFLWGITLVVIGKRIAKPQTIDLDWESVPERLRPVLKATVKTGSAAILILLLLLGWNSLSHHPLSPEILRGALATLLFAWEALFFTYGPMRSDEKSV